MKKHPPATIDEYIEPFPKNVQRLLTRMRQIILEAAPDATECICYGIPTFKLSKNLVHFGGYAKHIGFYPGPTGIRAFEEHLSEYTFSKGAIQFPLGEPLPHGLISKIVAFRVRESKQKKPKMPTKRDLTKEKQKTLRKRKVHGG